MRKILPKLVFTASPLVGMSAQQAPNGSVSGQVVDITGAGIAAFIELDQTSIRAGVDGTFHIKGLSPGSHNLAASMPGFISERIQFKAAGAEVKLPLIRMQIGQCGLGAPHADLVFLPDILDRGGLSGDVSVGDGLRSAMRRVPNVQVTLMPGRERLQSTRSDGAGRFRFERLLPGFYAVVAGQNGFYDERLDQLEVRPSFDSGYFGMLQIEPCIRGNCIANPRPPTAKSCE